MNSRGMLALRRYPEFLKLWLGRVVSRFGDSIDTVAYMWMIYELTGSGTQMGLLMAVNFLPNLLFGMIGGVLADRRSKKVSMLMGDIGRGTIVAITALLFGAGLLRIWHLYVFTFANSTLESFAAPARTSCIPLLVSDKQDILAANSLSSASSSLAEILGLGIAGAIIGQFGVAAAMLVDAITFFVSAFCIACTRIPGGELSSSSRLTLAGFKQDIAQGFSLAFGNRLIRLCIIMGASLNAFISPFSILSPIFSDQILKAGPQGFASMNVALAASMLLGAVLVGQFGNRFNHRQLILIGSMSMGFGFLIISAARLLALAVAGAALAGFGASILTSSVVTIVMTRCRSDFLGRVSSVMNATMMAAMPASSALTGLAVQSFGPVALIGVIGVLVLLTGIATAASPHLRSDQNAEGDLVGRVRF